MHKDFERFKSHWLRFSSCLCLDEGLSQALFDRLTKAYTEPQRAYHTIQHIVECLEHVQTVQSDLNDPIAVETAIWFHDVVYDPKAFDNELQSAEWMSRVCDKFLSAQQIEKVYQWIMATQKHQPSNDHDLNTLLDIDLAILGASPQRFAEYEQQIRLEYQWVESDIYHIKRTQVLQHFVQMNPIYQTAYFQYNFEKQAKINLSHHV